MNPRYTDKFNHFVIGQSHRITNTLNFIVYHIGNRPVENFAVGHQNKKGINAKKVTPFEMTF